jgi:Uri superfamily endonuclease
MSFALLLTVRHRNAVTYQQYKAALTNGAYYYNGRQFDNAAAWFREAVRLRPRAQDDRAPRSRRRRRSRSS